MPTSTSIVVKQTFKLTRQAINGGLSQTAAGVILQDSDNQVGIGDIIAVQPTKEELVSKNIAIAGGTVTSVATAALYLLVAANHPVTLTFKQNTGATQTINVYRRVILEDSGTASTFNTIVVTSTADNTDVLIYTLEA
jgi:hypothetical protein